MNDWTKGFDDGYEFAIKNFNPQTGSYNIELPGSFRHRVGEYNCGFGEGLISGRGIVLDKTFPGWKRIHWPNGKADVTK